MCIPQLPVPSVVPTRDSGPTTAVYYPSTSTENTPIRQAATDSPTCRSQVIVALPVRSRRCSAAATATVEYVVSEPARPPTTTWTIGSGTVVSSVSPQIRPALYDPMVFTNRLPYRDR